MTTCQCRIDYVDDDIISARPEGWLANMTLDQAGPFYFRVFYAATYVECVAWTMTRFGSNFF